MAGPYIMPLGFIDRTTDDGAIIMLTKPSESHNLKLETPVTLTPGAPENGPACRPESNNCDSAMPQQRLRPGTFQRTTAPGGTRKSHERHGRR